MAFADPVSHFVSRHPTVQMLALSFLILIGVFLVAEGLGRHIDRGYIYFAMQFETVNVQQFLTDVSATGEEGGFAEAEKSAAIFRQGVARFESLASRNGNTAQLAELKALSADFEAMADGLQAVAHGLGLGGRDRAGLVPVQQGQGVLGDLLDLHGRP